MRLNNKGDTLKIGIPVIGDSPRQEEDPMWTSFYGNIIHPDFNHPVFFRHNGSNVNLFNWYNGDTVYVIGRGPSLGEYIENKEIQEMLLHPAIVKFGMNTSADVLENNVNLWSGVDKLKKFSASIFKNPNIMKFVPMNRFHVMYDGSKDIDHEQSVAYKDDFHKYSCLCPNIVGVQTFLLEPHTKTKMSFGNAYLGSPAVLYGYYKGIKSVFLFTLKLCMLLGFKKIVLLGVDFKMDTNEPYYNCTNGEYQKFHVDHNNTLYTTLSPLIKEIINIIDSGKSGYQTKIFTAKKIDSMPFIETINLKEELRKEISNKT